MLTRKVDLIFLCFSTPITSILCYSLPPDFFFNCYESFRMPKAFPAINKTQHRVPNSGTSAQSGAVWGLSSLVRTHQSWDALLLRHMSSGAMPGKQLEALLHPA